MSWRAVIGPVPRRAPPREGGADTFTAGASQASPTAGRFFPGGAIAAPRPVIVRAHSRCRSNQFWRPSARGTRYRNIHLLRYLLFTLALASAVLAQTHVQVYEPDRGNTRKLAGICLVRHDDISVVTRNCPGPTQRRLGPATLAGNLQHERGRVRDPHATPHHRVDRACPTHGQLRPAKHHVERTVGHGTATTPPRASTIRHGNRHPISATRCPGWTAPLRPTCQHVHPPAAGRR
jgi:hypothetical protein